MKNDITTIQLRRHVKNMLEELKEKSNESYEDVIVKLIDNKDSALEDFEKLMIEGYKEMDLESLKISKEFDRIEDFRDWEW